MSNRGQDQSKRLYDRARAVIPGGVPGIRAPGNFVEGAYPVFLAGGSGAYITDVDGNEYLDLLLGYGPMILGHSCEEVDAAALERQRAGFCLNLPQPVLVELAERLVAIVPSAEQALFFKTGSDATTAAVRLARAYTGRAKVLRCGYHGWHDWCLAGDAGVPRGRPCADLTGHRNSALDLSGGVMATLRPKVPLRKPLPPGLRP